jgi:hypothetical protein
MLNKKLLGSVSAPPAEYVEDVFSTYLYTGNGSTQTITNGIDLAGEGGIVWTKTRGGTENHWLYTSALGTGGTGLITNTTDSNSAYSNYNNISSFNADGFTLGTATAGNQSNPNGTTAVSWTFRKAKKFFDVVTYTGNGSSSRTVSHNLGSAPGMMIVKKTSGTGNWIVYSDVSGTAKNLRLNTTGAAESDNWLTYPTSTTFTVFLDSGTGAPDSLNDSGATYVAYLFADDAGGFGTAGTDNIITCGSFTGGSPATVNLGYEPQWLLIKSTTNADDWYMFDTMRGWTANFSGLNYLRANTSAAEVLNGSTTPITSTGFQFNYGSGQTFIYMAIRRPMKVPTVGTSVFTTDAAGANASANGEVFSSSFPVDFHFRKERSSSGNNWFSNSRLIPGSSLTLNTTNAESSLAYVDKYDRMSGIATTNGFDYTDWAGWLFKRAPGFFDIVCYTGTGSARTITHNLGVAPELMIVKRRNGSSDNWCVYSVSTGNTKYMYLNTNDAADTFNLWNDTTPTSSVFSVSSGAQVNSSAGTYVAYLFATLAGVSKVGSYTGNGSSQTISCGFTAGARFVLIKRTDDTGDWCVFDTARGIVSGNDPFLQLNSTAAEVTGEDAVDAANSGFIVNETTEALNTNNATYIFLAIA